MRKNILVLVPHGSCATDFISSMIAQNQDVLFKSVNSLAPLPELKLLLEHDIHVVAARGNNADTLHKFYPELALVEIPVTAYDVLRALPKDFHGFAAVITCGLKVIGLPVIAEVSHIRLLDYTCSPLDQIPAAIEDAIKKGAGLILGGTITCHFARQLFPHVQNLLLPVGEESMQQTLRETRQIYAAIQNDIADQEYNLKSINTLSEGLIAVENQHIRLANDAAGRILGGYDGSSLLGKPSTELPSDLLTWDDAEEENEKVVMLRGVPILIRRACRNDSPDSFFLTLHDKKDLEEMEGQVRRKTFLHREVTHYTFSDIFGMSPSVSEAVRLARIYARSESNILITGESGCGKEVFAQSIHYASPRSKGPFIAVNCAAFTKELLSSELFGYVEGAFTGASRQGKPGIFEVAHGGTVFLDEISEMDFSMQASLLRVLQEGCVMRIGSHKVIPVDTRIIAATNKDLQTLANNGSFRLDLFYRLNVLLLHVPALRERVGDILPLLKHFLKELVGVDKKRKYSFDASATRLVNSYPWPGNVRELGNIAQRIAATCPSLRITEKMLREVLQLQVDKHPAPVQIVQQARAIRTHSQINEIRKAIQDSGGKLGEAARRLGIDRTTLWRKMKKDASLL